ARADGVRGGVRRTGDQTIGQALVDHHRGVVRDVLHGLPRLVEGHTLGLAQLREVLGELLQLGTAIRVREGRAGEVQLQLAGALSDRARVAQDGTAVTVVLV